MFQSSHSSAVPSLQNMSTRKRKADEDGDENMSPMSSPAVSSRPLIRPSKKFRSNDLIGRPLPLPRLLETLDTNQLRTVLERICERHPDIGQEVVSQAPRPTVGAAMDVLQSYQDRLNAAAPYGNSSAEYTYDRVKAPLVALIDALSDFTPQFLPPIETQPTKSLEFLDGATRFIHNLPNWQPQAYRHHKENAYEDLSKAWALVINEAAKRGGGFNLHTDGWDQKLARHNEQSGGRLGTAITAMSNSVGWISNENAEQNSILNQIVSGAYGAPVRVGPCPGDQHQEWPNPFEEAKPRISGWSAKEIATIASRLDKQLGPEYISSRAGPGGSRVHYLTAEKVIGLANEVFGFNGWSSSIQNIQVDFADENPTSQRVSIGLSVIVRVTLRDGTYHEDVGYGSIENAKGKAMAFEKAKKEGTTDALKRTLRNFGNILGNCIYDQDYVKQVTKIKAQTNKKFDPDNLHRHSDFAKKEVTMTSNVSNAGNSTANNAAVTATTAAPTSAAGGFKIEPMDSFDDFLGELDEADFCVPGDGHPDEIMLPSAVNPPNDKPTTNESRPGQPARPMPGNNLNRPPQPQPYTPRQGQPPRPQNAPQGKEPLNQTMAPPPPQAPPPGEPVAFFSARSTMPDTNQAGNQNQQKQLFNPKAESPSIRKTPGIDHTSSKPVARNGQHVPPANSQAPSTQNGNTGGFTSLRQSIGSSQARGNPMNPSLDQARRIGAPGGGLGSPLANRGQYKPPTMKRTLPSEANAANGTRSPLADIPTNAGNGNGEDGLDAKRQKVA
ncbi:hypothetical protein J3E68DRAFT_422021 [Trichoderma sp. SZMC 28012]